MVDAKTVFEVITLIPLVILLGIYRLFTYTFNGFLYIIYIVTWKIFKKWPKKSIRYEDPSLLGDGIGDMRKMIKCGKSLFGRISERCQEYGDFWEEVHYCMFNKYIDPKYYYY